MTVRLLDDLTRPARLRALLAEAGLRPSKRLGQHFLVDRGALRRIVDLADPGPEDAVLEIGPGPGALTVLLAQRAGRVVAVERDPRFEPLLRRVLAGQPHVSLVFADALALDWSALLTGAARPLFVSNLPYSITSPVLLRLVEGPVAFRRAVVMVQLEVARRVTASPGSPEYGALTVALALRAEARLAFMVSRQRFWPQPEVDSAVVVLEPAARALAAPPELAARVARAAFARRRKTLLNALSGELALERDEVLKALRAAGVDPERRGETLSPEQFARVAAALGPRLGGGPERPD